MSNQSIIHAIKDAAKNDAVWLQTQQVVENFCELQPGVIKCHLACKQTSYNSVILVDNSDEFFENERTIAYFKSSGCSFQVCYSQRSSQWLRIWRTKTVGDVTSVSCQKQSSTWPIWKQSVYSKCAWWKWDQSSLYCNISVTGIGETTQQRKVQHANLSCG